MKAVQILYSYIENLEKRKVKLLEKLQTLQEDMEEVAKVNTILYDYKLEPYIDIDGSKPCSIYWVAADGKDKFRFFLKDIDLLFSINVNGKYIFYRRGSTYLAHPSIKDEVKYLSAFCEYFPKYRDAVFKHIESFQNK